MEDLLGADAPLTEPQEPLRQPQEQDPPPQDNIYRQNILRRQEQRRQMLVESFNVGVKSDPVKAREADRYARELGLPVGVAERKLDEVAAIVAKRNFDAEQMSALNPTLAQQLRDPAFARMAHDDIDNLSIYERAMRGARIGELTAERGRVGTALGVFDDPASRRRIAEIDEEIRQLGEPQGIVGNAAQFFGLTAKVAARATAVGGAAAATAAVVGQLGPQAAVPEEIATVPAAFALGFKASFATDFAAINIGNEYANLVALGVPRTTAQLTALGVGAVNTALDLGGFSMLTAPVRSALAKGAREAIVEGVAKPTIGKAAIKAAVDLAKGAGGEIGTEMLQDVVSIVGEAAATGDPSRLDDMARRVGETGLKTAQAMVLLGTPGPIMTFRREVQRVKAAEQAQKPLDTMMAATANGKMHAENPAAFQKAVDAANPGTSYYIDGKTFAEVLAQRDEQEAQESPDALKKRLIERIPADLQVRIGDAIEKGGVVEMSPAEFLTAFGNTPEGKALQQHVRVGDPDAMTAAEAAKVDIEAMAKDAETQAEKQQADAETWTAEAKAIEDDIATQLDAARPGKKMEARETARGWRAVVETITDRIGETPKWFAEQWKVKIQQGEVAADALAQGETKTDSPEFKAWFGESKVVDKEGKPLVVYHGTRADFSTFDRGTGVLGAGFYFTTDAKEAAVYARTANGRDARGRPLGERTMPVLLRIKNPASVEDVNRVSDGLDSSSFGWFNEVRSRLRADGFDGVIGQGMDGGTVYVAFDPTQIKSVNNRGTFDPNDPNILRQDGDDPESYRGRHRPPMRGNGAPLHDLTGGGEVYPDDVYSANGARYYGTGNAAMDRETVNLAQSFRGKPDAEVTIYRAVPKSAGDAIKAGDWVTINRKYAAQHGESALGGDYKIVQQKVKASDIFTNGDSIQEWGYDPAGTLRQYSDDSGGVTRGGFQRIANELRITLTPDANFSTPIHEMLGHALLEVYGDLALQKAHPTIVDDFQTLLDWGGIKDAAEWKALPMEKRKGLHEKFAREWEAFVWEGKEPSSGLKRLFAVLSRLIRRVYETILSIPGREAAPPQVRAVLERMIASDKEVQVAQAIRGAVPLFQTQEESGLDDAAWQQHEAKQREAYEAARDELTRQDMENMKWLGVQVGKLAAQQRKEIAHLREGERQKVAAEVEKRPVYRAMRWLKTGEMVNPDGTKTNDGLPHKMSREAVRDLLGLKELDETSEPAPVKAPKVKRGPSLLTRIKQLGGISTESWNKSWPGEKRGEFRLPFVVRSKGMKWEAMASQLRSEGYAPQANDEAGVGSGDSMWLVDALSDAASGVPTYSALDEGAANLKDTRNPEPETAEERADRLEAERMDAEQERARSAFIQVAKPEKELTKLRGMLAATGYSPDDVAQVFGMRSGGDLVQGILDAPPMQEVIEARTDEVMLEKHTDLMDPRKREASIYRALHNETRRRFTASEINVLMKAQEPVRVTMAAAKKAAEVAIGNKRVKELNPRAFTAAAKRASIDAVEAQKAGEIENAIAYKRRELVLSEMALLAIDAQKEVAKGEALFRQAARSDKEVSKSRDIDYVYAMRLLGSKFGLSEPIEAGQKADLTANALAKLVEERPDLASRVDSLVALAGKGGGLRYRDVSLSLFREVAELGSMLWDSARDATLLLADGKRKQVAEVVSALAGQIASLPPPNSTKALPTGGNVPPWRRAMLGFWNVIAATKRMESVAWWLDGNKVGPFTRLIVQPIMRGEAKHATAKAKMVAAVHADLMAVREASGSAWLSKVYAEELDYTFANKSELLRAIAYMGTESGARKWLLGERGKNGKTLGDLVEGPDGELVLDTSRWDAFLARTWREGIYLKESDAKFLTKLWAHFRDLLPQVQAVHKASSNHEYETLAERPVQTPFGTLQGGYIPVRADYDKAKPTVNYLKLDELGKHRENIAFSIGTERGFTLKRNENYLQPLSLDLGKLLAHLDEELAFIHLELPTKDVAKIIKGSMEVANADGTTSKVKMLDVMNGYDRAIVPNVLQPWLENVALQRTTRQGRWLAVDRSAMLLRRVSSLSRLAFNVTNSLLQATGISVAASQTPRRYVWSALTTVLKNPAAAIRDMLDSSEAMRARADVDTAALQQDISRMNLGAVRGSIKAAQQFAGMVGFWITRKVQQLADVVTWQAEKAHAEANGADQDAAVQAADGAVSRSQGGHRPSQQAAIEVQTPSVQLLFQFGSYSLTILNTLMSSRTKASTLAWAVLVPTLIESMLRQAVRPPEDDDADGIIDEMAANYASQLGRNLVSMMPLVGPTALALAKSEGVRVQDAPAISTVKDAVAGAYELAQALGGEEITASDWRKIAVFLTVVTQLPVAAPTSLVQDLTGTRR